MNKINVTPNKITIEYIKKLPFFKKKKIVYKDTLLKDIKFITREECDGIFFAITILKKKGNSIYLDCNKFEDLESIYTLLLKYHNKENNYEISIIDVNSMKETKII